MIPPIYNRSYSISADLYNPGDPDFFGYGKDWRASSWLSPVFSGAFRSTWREVDCATPTVSSPEARYSNIE